MFSTVHVKFQIFKKHQFFPPFLNEVLLGKTRNESNTVHRMTIMKLVTRKLCVVQLSTSSFCDQKAMYVFTCLDSRAFKTNKCAMELVIWYEVTEISRDMGYGTETSEGHFR
uniref:Uncharacterized protein n=1 Tax=Cacopsylla melanoneura TaxID=428564 RepID=A0A8D9B1C8_9HEMI